MMSNNDFDEFISQIYNSGGNSYRPSVLGSARNQAIEDLIKSLTEQAEKYCDEIDKKRKHEPKFTDEEFNKTCDELGLVEDK